MFFPRIVLERDESDIRRNSSGNVDAYMLRITNIGNTTARNVNIRSLKVTQGETHFVLPHDRYLDFTHEAIQNGDYISTNFINNHKDMEWFMTPAVRDKRFPRKKTHFILLISGDNFPSYRKNIIIEPIKGTKDLKITL